jgi:hypothetical protein
MQCFTQFFEEKSSKNLLISVKFGKNTKNEEFFYFFSKNQPLPLE